MERVELKKAQKYGEDLYLIKTTKSLSENQEITCYADGVTITDSGDIVFSYMDDNDNEIVSLSIAKSEWKAFYLCDKKGENPLSVRRWTGVAGIRIIEKILPAPKREVEVFIPEETPPVVAKPKEEIDFNSLSVEDLYTMAEKFFKMGEKKEKDAEIKRNISSVETVAEVEKEIEDPDEKIEVV